MLLRLFYDPKLAQASYLIGCQRTGEAIVVDPCRDVEPYLAAAAVEGVRVTHITETHIHADFVSGTRELASRTGAAIHLSDEGDASWKYTYAAAAGATLVRDGDAIRVGNIRLDVMHTPGHTPEHLCFMVTDTVATERPMGVLTGDFIFVGDVGRPDLLERAAGWTGTMDAAARTLFRSLQKFRRLPDYLQLWPGHGAGSACGKALGAVPSTTLGYERIANWAFAIEDEDAFVREVLAGQPEPPAYFAEMKRMNKEGPAVLGGFVMPPRLAGHELVELLDAGAIVVDTRTAPEFAAAHAPRTLGIPLNRAFSGWAGWLVPYDRDFYLLVDDDGGERVHEAVRDLAMVGLDRVAGWLGADALGAWSERTGRALGSTPQITPAEAARRLERGEVRVLDVRGRAEWEAGHIPGAENIPVGMLRERLSEVPVGKPLVVQCQSGARSSIAASVLRAAGVHDVVNLEGGFGAWVARGLPVEV